MASSRTLDELAGCLLFGPLLARLGALGARPELVAHWKQGEFHHDYVFRLAAPPGDLPGDVLVVSTNCNAGVKAATVFGDVPARWALWRLRCPDNPEFEGTAPAVLAESRTTHWFDPCTLLSLSARSELRADARLRQRGGGWVPRDSAEELSATQPLSEPAKSDD